MHKYIVPSPLIPKLILTSCPWLFVCVCGGRFVKLDFIFKDSSFFIASFTLYALIFKSMKIAFSLFHSQVR